MHQARVFSSQPKNTENKSPDSSLLSPDLRYMRMPQTSAESQSSLPESLHLLSYPSSEVSSKEFGNAERVEERKKFVDLKEEEELRESVFSQSSEKVKEFEKIGRSGKKSLQDMKDLMERESTRRFIGTCSQELQESSEEVKSVEVSDSENLSSMAKYSRERLKVLEKYKEERKWNDMPSYLAIKRSKKPSRDQMEELRSYTRVRHHTVCDLLLKR